MLIKYNLSLAQRIFDPGHSSYGFALNNPIIYKDPDGEDVFLVIYSSEPGDVGHAAIAVENYRKVENKVVENGHEIIKVSYEKDGTLNLYELGPGNRKGVGIAKALFNVRAK